MPDVSSPLTTSRPGCHSQQGRVRLCGRDDLGLHDGNWSFAIVAGFTDADACRACDQDEEHNRARAGLLPVTEQTARAQFGMP